MPDTTTHRHRFTITPGGAYECPCGFSHRPFPPSSFDDLLSGDEPVTDENYNPRHGRKR